MSSTYSRHHFLGWLFARGQFLWILICKRPATPYGHLQRGEGGEEILAAIQTVEQEVLADLKIWNTAALGWVIEVASVIN